jgi:ABC-type branched-subunit amino acid transport system substrate-binding protein
MSHASSRLDRRAFLCSAANAFACVVGVHTLPSERQRVISPSVRVGVVVGGRNDEYATSAMGIDLGIDEATRAASLLGGAVEVVSRVGSVENAVALVKRDRLSAMMCAANADEIAELGRECANLNTPLINLAAGDDSLRNQRCSRFTFHVCVSDAMRDGALRTLAASSSRTDATIELWSSHLERFGAAQLNDRFQSRFHRPMDSLAWAGWFAVKVAWEASLRVRSADGSAIAGYLERETTQFDGQKGVPLSFRRWDHQLRQPLYAVAASRSSEPLSIPAATGASRDELDVLGTTKEASSCHWG